jgi:hypothetical protein
MESGTVWDKEGAGTGGQAYIIIDYVSIDFARNSAVLAYPKNILPVYK